jgi:hypothetical protein
VLEYDVAVAFVMLVQHDARMQLRQLRDIHHNPPRLIALSSSTA